MSAGGREICRVGDRKSGEIKKDWKDDKDPGKVVHQSLCERRSAASQQSDYWLDWFYSTSVEDGGSPNNKTLRWRGAAVRSETKKISCFYLPREASRAHLSVLGLQAQLVPADGLDVSGLGQDLDAFRRLHQQRAGGRLQPGKTEKH